MAKKIAVVGGTGQVGRPLVTHLQDEGHDVVVVSRSTGVDVTGGGGLDAALAGVEVVVDVTSTDAVDPAEVDRFFTTATTNLLAAGVRAGVAHHVLLSILRVDEVEGNAHYAGKRTQEALVRGGPTPWTIVRAAQFFDFAGMVAGWTTQGDTATVAPLLVQPVAISDVAEVLAEVAIAAPERSVIDLAGPESQDLVDMARRTLEACGTPLKLRASWRNGPFGTDMAGEVLLAGPDARIAGTTFDDWLVGERRRAT